MNPALLDPAPTVTLPGTVTLALLSDNATLNPPSGAGPLRVIVQVEDPGAFTLAGVHVRPLSDDDGMRFTTVVAFVPLQFAVTVTVPLEITVPAAAVKVPLPAPALIVMFGGTLNELRLLDRPTVAALVAAFVNVTVQVVL